MTVALEPRARAQLYPGITYVIPCGKEKLDRPATARDLYIGRMFRHALSSAERSAQRDGAMHGCTARVLVLSGRHGLIELDELLEPYDQRIDAPGAVSVATLAEQATALGIGSRSVVHTLLPRPYFHRLDQALKSLYVYAQDMYEGCRGNGEQRRVNALISQRDTPAGDGTWDGEPGLRVWIGGDVSALWWGQPVLVSYERLQQAKVLPVATAPWVLDSGAYRHLERHRTWTVPAARYAEDIRRYAAEIRRLRWAAPQDWPAGTHTLAVTGLTEFDHQIRTIASVRELRAADTGVHVLAVVTAQTPAGYLRHVDMYLRAGIDLRTEPLVGVGALLGRPPREAAEIVRLLHAAGLTRLHAFGGKGRLVEAVGALLTSIDSAGWSDQARRTDDLCPHEQSGVRWERNCPHAATAWAARQRALAARACGRGVQADPWGPVLVDLLGPF